MRRYARQLPVEFDLDSLQRVVIRSLHQIWKGAEASPTEASSWDWPNTKGNRLLDRQWNSQSSTSAATVLNSEGTGDEREDSPFKERASSGNDISESSGNLIDEGEMTASPSSKNEEATEEMSSTDGTNDDRIPLAYDLPREWYSQTMSPSHRRDRMVIHLSEWAKRRIMTPKLLLKLLQGPLCPHELSRYTSNNISRIVYAVGLMKKTERLIGHPATIDAFLKHLWFEATDRKRLMTYDGIGLSQTAFGFSMMKMDDPEMFAPFAQEAIKPHRIRNTLGKSLVNLLDSLYHGGYNNVEHVEIISQAAVRHANMLPTFALPRLVNAWGHFKYNNTEHIRAVLNETLKETRLNSLLAIHIEEILSACAKMQFKETTIIASFVRELIYSQKWKFMTHGSLPRIVLALGMLQYEHPSHWKQILDATLSEDVLESLESNLIVDIYTGWSKVAYRDSRMLDRLGLEANKNKRLEIYSTRQLFEIFKAQRLLGQVEKRYTKKMIEKLKDTEKLMKCNVETKIQIVLHSNAKAVLGIENVEALMKAICQPMCLEPLEDRVLIQLAHEQSTLGTSFGTCFEYIVKEATKMERLQRMDTQLICRLLGIWHRLGYEDNVALESVTTECSETNRLQTASAEEVLKLIWTVRQLNKEAKMPRLLREAMQRSASTFTAKGIAMLLSAVVEQDLVKDDVQPFVEGLVGDAAFAKEKSPAKTEIVNALKALGFENAALQLQQSIVSKENTQTADN